MIFITLSQEDQVLLINTDDDFEDGDCQDNSEANNNIRNCEKNRKVLKQSIKLPNQLLLKAKKVKAKFIYFLHKFVYFHWQFIIIMYGGNRRLIMILLL